jgi:hypothetical protein
MTKTTFQSIVEERLQHTQVESTLYMPSMYDTGDEDDGTDQRDEINPRERKQNAPRSPRFSLQRCHESYRHLFPEYSESNISMVKSFGSFHSAVVDAVSSNDFQINTTSKNGIRPVHWEEQVTVDKNLVSFLSSKRQ